MPRKNSQKIYLVGGYYHIYNRGIEKRDIFLDPRDYKTFLYFLKKYLDPLGSDPIKGQTLKQLKRNLSQEVKLLAYCLMPNHFHLLLKQESERGMTKLMRAVCTNYVMYFNKRYEREGPLFQSVYKAVLITRDDYLLHLSRYIHLNPFDLEKRDFNKLIDYSYSSYADYLGKRKTNWLETKEILNYFESEPESELNSIFSYQNFVEDYQKEFDRSELLLDSVGP